MTTNGGNTELDNDAGLEKRTFQTNYPIPNNRRFVANPELEIAPDDTTPLFRPSLCFASSLLQLERVPVDLFTLEEDVPDVSAVGDVRRRIALDNKQVR